MSFSETTEELPDRNRRDPSYLTSYLVFFCLCAAAITLLPSASYSPVAPPARDISASVDVDLIEIRAFLSFLPSFLPSFFPSFFLLIFGENSICAA
jgi:hypothetical protein